MTSNQQTPYSHNEPVKSRNQLTGEVVPAGFDFTGNMLRLCDDITQRHERMTHINMDFVAVAFSQTRKGVRHGVHATLTPMRFENGAREGIRNGKRYGAQRLFDYQGREMLYILKFYLPRFQNEPFLEKLTTVFHELWHISADFNGDLRRFEGRCYIHSASEKEYDRQMMQYAQQWLGQNPPAELFEFLQGDFKQLEARHSRIVGMKIPQPKLLPRAARVR
jgi:hypothetical protein